MSLFAHSLGADPGDWQGGGGKTLRSTHARGI